VSIVDDLCARRDLPAVIDLAREGPVPVRVLGSLAAGDADRVNRETYGERWTTALVDLAVRAGIGRLERDADGEVVLVPAARLPTPEGAWRTATGL
jgi:hypothetical protein